MKFQKSIKKFTTHLTSTLGMEEAVLAADFIQCNQIIGCHYNTFPPIEIELSQAQHLFEAQKRTLHLPKIGQSLSL
jgi:L-ascorbate metabolism protein UlaG (beta-lactamase superfamily)